MNMGSGNSRQPTYDRRPPPRPVPVSRGPLPGPEEPITVREVDLNIYDNTRDHHTNEYDATRQNLLVVRRGQTFEVDIVFNREFDPRRDDVRLVFKFGKALPNAEFNLRDKPKAGEWGGIIRSKRRDSVKVRVFSPDTCAVGKWTLSVQRRDNGTAVYKYDHPEGIYVLFNPWNKADPVYLGDSSGLKEYVLNESGRIFSGSHKRITAKPWSFGQFEGIALDCVMFLLDEKSGIDEESRGDPIVICRRISALVNANDDNGVLVGNWTGKYQGGTSPLAWNGSVDILKQFYATKASVKYGQCWVFSGIVTTLCRALGIPTRSVTNFASAHDTDGSITIDKSIDETGKPLDKADSVWNFHVWNEVWMTRADLPTGNDGWQVIDATPQELSNGLMCLGPASVKSIKSGNVQLLHDGKFVFAEVNADRLTWLVKEDGSKVLQRKDKHSVGKYISTKSVRGQSREDITNEYKHREGSREEREAVKTAIESHELERMDLLEVYYNGPEDVKAVFDINPDTFLGDTVEILLRVKNTSREERSIDGHILVYSITYQGQPYSLVKDHVMNGETIDTNGEHVIPVQIPASEYLHLLTDHCLLGILCRFIVNQTEQPFYDQDSLRLRKPHLTVKAPNKGSVGEKIEVRVSFTNPLAVTLTGCELRAEGAGLQEPLVQQHGTVEAGSDFSATFDITPSKPGNRELAVNFNCDQISNVNAGHEIMIR